MSLDEWIYNSAENVYPEMEVVPVDKTREAIKKLQEIILINSNILNDILLKVFGKRFVNVVGNEQ